MMTVNEALAKVSENLKSGRISPSMFNMKICLEHRDCGTVGCIGGWMMTYMNMSGIGENMGCLAENLIATTALSRIADNDSELHELFYPSMSINWGLITPEHAAAAIDQYLSNGKIDWHEVPGAPMRRDGKRELS